MSCQHYAKVRRTSSIDPLPSTSNVSYATTRRHIQCLQPPRGGSVLRTFENFIPRPHAVGCHGDDVLLEIQSIAMIFIDRGKKTISKVGSCFINGVKKFLKVDFSTWATQTVSWRKSWHDTESRTPYQWQRMSFSVASIRAAPLRHTYISLRELHVAFFDSLWYFINRSMAVLFFSTMSPEHREFTT